MFYYNDLQAMIQQWLAMNRRDKNIEVAQSTRLSTSWNPEDVGKCLLISRYESCYFKLRKKNTSLVCTRF